MSSSITTGKDQTSTSSHPIHGYLETNSNEIAALSYGSISDSKLNEKNSKGQNNGHKEVFSSISMGESFNSSSHDSDSPGTNLTASDLEEESSPILENSVIAPTGKISLRRIAIDISLYLNLFILFSKILAYAHTLSLSVLAALTDSLLDVISQLVLFYTERTSSMSRSSAHYPAGAARLEPIGVLTCAALMGMASFEILKESVEALVYENDASLFNNLHMISVYGMTTIVALKLILFILCQRARPDVYKKKNGKLVKVKGNDATLEALALDHWNDALSNGVAAVALFCAILSRDLWFLDPVGAIIISLYIIYSWFETGRDQIEQLTGKCAPDEFIDELYDLVNNFDSTGKNRIIVDVVRAYHFGPKFLVEVEIVLPKDTLLMESHDIGMELQYEIEGRDEVERCFVHIDYEQRPYDEHVVSKVPELRERYRPSASGNTSFVSGLHSV